MYFFIITYVQHLMANIIILLYFHHIIISRSISVLLTVVERTYNLKGKQHPNKTTKFLFVNQYRPKYHELIFANSEISVWPRLNTNIKHLCCICLRSDDFYNIRFYFNIQAINIPIWKKTTYSLTTVRTLYQLRQKSCGFIYFWKAVLY